MPIVKITIADASANASDNKYKSLTPTDIERTSGGETVSDDLKKLLPSHRFERDQERLQRCSPDTEEHENVDDQEFVVAGHDTVVKGGQRDDSMCFLGDKDCGRSAYS